MRAPLGRGPQAGKRGACITLALRKCRREPEQLWRKCVCDLQGRRLCGVCVLHRRGSRAGALVFPGLTYADSLSLLKLAAMALALPRAAEWGTHAFRRGRADEVLRSQGPAAMFAQGGWRSVAAWAYPSARAMSEIMAAEEAIGHSDSSEGEEPA